jgi:hypothetical protein
MLACEKLMLTCGVSRQLTPAARAMSQSPRRSFWHASCTATSDDEHAVSIDSDGPVKS